MSKRRKRKQIRRAPAKSNTLDRVVNEPVPVTVAASVPEEGRLGIILALLGLTVILVAVFLP